MRSKIQRYFPLVAALAVFCTTFYFLFRILPGIQGLEIDIESDHPDNLQVFYSNNGTFLPDKASRAFPIKGKRSTIKIPFAGIFSTFLRIDTGDHKGTVKIYQVKIYSYFHASLVFGPKEIGELFVPGPDASIQVFPDHVQVVASGIDPYLRGKTRIFPTMHWKASLIALLSAFVVGLILFGQLKGEANQKALAGIPARSPQPERFDALDGLRGIAAIMVITDHTCSWFKGLGASGVWIFFALSGFLLARPFIGNAHAVLSFTSMSGYCKRRFMRIVPMYYAFIFVTYVLTGRFNLAFLHGLFLEGDGHLWALPQEVLFYLLWPVVVLILVLPLRNYPKTTILGLLLSMAAWNQFITIETIWLLGMDHIKLPLFFGIFLGGTFFSFLYSYCSPAECRGNRFNNLACYLASPLGFIILIFFLLLSTGNIFNQKIVYSQLYFGYYGFLAGLLIFCILYAKGRLLDKFLTMAPLRELGTVGLSLYLLHPMVKSLIESFLNMYFDYKLSNFSTLLATLGCTYLLARYTFNHIEQPGFQEKTARHS